MTLGRCVGETAPFFADHWSRVPFLRTGGAGYDDLLSLADVDRYISTSGPRRPALRLVRGGRSLDPASYTRRARIAGQPITGLVDPGRVWDEFAAGATVVLQGLQRTWAPLARFARQLEGELTHPVQVNAYLTPPGERGLDVHYDTHDVFVLQVAGRKEWHVYEAGLRWPLSSQAWKRGGDHGREVLCPVLAPGDSLYIPRGFPHAAQSVGDCSLHLTVGVLVVTWADFARQALAGLDGDEGWREALPPGWAEDSGPALASQVGARLAQLAEWVAARDPAALMAAASRRFWTGRPPLLEGHLQQLAALDRLDDRASVQPRAGTVCRVAITGETLDVVLGDRALTMPAAVEPAVRRLASGPVVVGTLADLMDEDSRLVLVRRLVREGLLEARHA